MYELIKNNVLIEKLSTFLRQPEGMEGLYKRSFKFMDEDTFEKEVINAVSGIESVEVVSIADRAQTKDSGEKKYPAEEAGELTAAQIYQLSTIPERESLKQYLASSALSSALDKRAIIIAHDTSIVPGQVAQAGERSINRYLDGKLMDVRGTGKKLLDGIEEAALELRAAGIPYKVVSIAGNGTMTEVGDDLKKVGKVLNIQNPDNRYMPIIGLYEVALRIAYDSSIDDVLLCLDRIAINPDNRPFTRDDVETLLSRGVLMILPKIIPVNPSEAAEAYRAAQQALVSL
jgi:hypothetical protein